MPKLKAKNGHDAQKTILETFDVSGEKWEENGQAMKAMLEEWATLPTLSEKYESLHRHFPANTRGHQLVLLRFIQVLDRFEFVTHGPESN